MLSPPGIFGKPRESAQLKASFNPSVQSSSRIGSSKKKINGSRCDHIFPITTQTPTASSSISACSALTK